MGYRIPDEAVHPVQRRWIDHGTDLRILREGEAHLQFPRPFGEGLREPVRHDVGDQ